MAEDKAGAAGIVGTLSGDAEMRWAWLIVTAAVVYLVVVGRVFRPRG